MTNGQVSNFVGRKYTTTYNGKFYFPLEPTADHISIEDIAHCSALLCRFGGHIKWFFSLAQHACMVADRVKDPKKKLKALLHDGSEAYLNDMIHPVKYLDTMKPYRKLEEKTEIAIAHHFGYLPDKDPEIKYADNVQLAVEANSLLPYVPEWAKVLAVELNIGDEEITKDQIWSPEVAEKKFMEAFEEYKVI